MAIWHHIDLENLLHQNNWKIVERIGPEDSLSFSGSWIIKREKELKINFNGLDDLITLPMEKSYACSVDGGKPSLYFYKKGKQWTKNLNDFISSLNDL